MTKGLSILLCGCVIFGSCSKTNPSPDPGSGGTTVVVPDGLQFPLKIGSFWKYQRIDTIISYHTATPVIKTDTSFETITIIGDTLLIAIDATSRLTVLQIKNTTKNTTDTNYISVTANRFSLYGHQFTITSRAYNDPIPGFKGPDESKLWVMYVSFSLPVAASSITMDSMRKKSPLGLDTVFIKKDSTLSVLNTVFLNCVYADRESYTTSFAPSGAGGGSYSHQSFIKPNAGFVFVKQEPMAFSGDVFNTYTLATWFTRRLVSFSIP